MEHVMVDLETLGRRAGCAVLSIGAVAFDTKTKELGPEFYTVVKLDSCVKAGLHIDPETVAWWARQSLDAQAVLKRAKSSRGNKSLVRALDDFSRYLEQFNMMKVKIWGNGSDFDNAILTNCYAAVGKSQPWDFWNNRCYRTLKGLNPAIKMQRQGTYHNALDDAKSQACHAIELLGAYGKKSK